MTALRVSRAPFVATLTASVAIAGLLFAGVASAAGPASSSTVEVARVVVGYGDLDLDTERGAAALQRRIVAAAREACGGSGQRDLRLRQAAQACTAAAISRAVDEVGSTRLAELHAARNRALRG